MKPRTGATRTARRRPLRGRLQQVFTLWDLIGRRPSDVPPGRTLHVIEHQVWRRELRVYACCHGVWSLKVPDGPRIAFNRIVTGPGRSDAMGPGWSQRGDVSISSGETHPEILKHCEIRADRIGKGLCFASGPLGSSGRRMGQGATDRLTVEQLRVVNELHFALAANPRRRRIDVAGKTLDQKASVTYESMPGLAPLWGDYVAAHRLKSGFERRKMLMGLIEELWVLCPYLPRATGPSSKLREEFLGVLMARRSTGEDRSRRRYLNAQDLAYGLASKVLGAAPKTLRRRVFLHSPYEASFA